MAFMLRFITIFSVFLLLFSLCFSSPFRIRDCDFHNFSTGVKFEHCNSLLYGSSEIHWNYTESTRTVKLAYIESTISSEKWVAWGINPTSRGMRGTQALVAYQKSNGIIYTYTSPIVGYYPNLSKGNLSFPVYGLHAVLENNEMIIFATLVLPGKTSIFNHAWNVGHVYKDTPLMHPLTLENKSLFGTLSFRSGNFRPGKDDNDDKMMHGALNVLGWGILTPVGVLVSRYLRVFESFSSAWFGIHRTCQTIGYVIAVFGCGTGLNLTQGMDHWYTGHRVVGIALICLFSLQALAFIFRPNIDHNHRNCWNRYHSIVGYAIIILSIINIFKGFNLLGHARRWRQWYVTILALLILTSVILEIVTWKITIRRMIAKQIEQRNRLNGVG